MKKLLLLLLGVLIALPSMARDFTYEYEGQTLTYTVIDEEAKTCGTKAGYPEYYGSDELKPGNVVFGSLILPAHPKDGDVEYTLISIFKCSFIYCGDLTSVEIPNSVQTIESSAFLWCSLTSVEIPNSVTDIRWGAFENCRSLTSVIIPNSVTAIASSTFDICI